MQRSGATFTCQLVVLQGDEIAGLEAFMAVEKQCRLAEDMALSRETCLAIINSLHNAGTWQLFLEHITILTKRRGQLKSTVQVSCATHARTSQNWSVVNGTPEPVCMGIGCVSLRPNQRRSWQARVQAVVRRAVEILATIDSQDKQVELIKCLQAVTEGKLFVEIDRARLTRRLAMIYEKDGKVGDAADAMQEIAVETFGAMHRSEKIAYVLEQMRLCMDNADFTRAQILSRKVRSCIVKRQLHHTILNAGPMSQPTMSRRQRSRPS